MLPPHSLDGFVALRRTNMLFYTHLDPFPITRQVWDLAFILALPEAAICSRCLCWAVCVGVGLCVSGCLHWAVHALCSQARMTMHVVGTQSPISSLSRAQEVKTVGFFFFFLRLAWQWSGLHHGYVSIKATHSYSNDLSPQPKGPFAVWLNTAAGLTGIRNRNHWGSSWVLCITWFLSLSRFMMLQFNVSDLNNLVGEEKRNVILSSKSVLYQKRTF